MSTIQPERLAIVEDSDEDFALYQRVLSQGRPLRRWASGEAALQDLNDGLASVEDFDLFIVDLNLPGIDGCQVIEQLRALAGHLPLTICMLTSSQRQADRDRAHAAGADGYLTKPTDMATLRALPNELSAIAA